ncbi:MAG: glycogen-binding domain-containing protein [Nitrosospira sp.]|nr:glycogen-binding domain-containing protein [Nitrosospira sp.]
MGRLTKFGEDRAMAVQVIANDDQYILNHCTRFLTRRNTDARHNFGQYDPSDPRARICEAWRFPIIDSHAETDGADGGDDGGNYAFNRVTFVYREPGSPEVSGAGGTLGQVGVIGTFAKLYEPIALSPVRFLGEPTGYFAVALRVPKGQAYRYKFMVDGKAMLDPVNPQQIREPNGHTWSRFFTHLCTQPLSFESWELAILERLVDHIMPFRTKDGQDFLQFFYNQLDAQQKKQQYLFSYRLDQSVGIVNFMDNLVAREERHHLIDYKICLELIANIVRQRAADIEPAKAPKEIFIGLYGEMASGQVAGWDTSRYNDPAYFLQMLRRHAFTGAFSHPKDGGNASGGGGRYLADRFRNAGGETLFDWERAIEQPLGTNADYHG